MEVLTENWDNFWLCIYSTLLACRIH